MQDLNQMDAPKTREDFLDVEKTLETYLATPEVIVAATSETAKCVDGGYRKNEAVGAMAIPGGHLGMSMVLLQMGYSPREAFDQVFTYVTAKGQKYGWHTDNHTEIGCGHCNQATKSGDTYGVQGAQVLELWKIVSEAQQNDSEHMAQVALVRDHAERAILVITGTENTVSPWNEAAGEAERQYFIYDKARHDIALRELAESLATTRTESADELFAQLQRHSLNQTIATLKALGTSKDKPLYFVNVDGGARTIEYWTSVPELQVA